jgi:hypothetical protein
VGESDLRVVWSNCILFEQVTKCENSSIEVDDTEMSESRTWMVMKIETPVCIADVDCRQESWMKLTSSCPSSPPNP